VAVIAALLGFGGCHSLARPSLSAASPVLSEPSAHPWRGRLHGYIPADPPGPFHGGRHHALGVGDGEVPDGVTVFDHSYPAVTKLDQDLLGALRAAATDAAGDGVEIYVNSGWRSEKYQEQLFEQAVAKYGSEVKAAERVARPGTSVHEAGVAVDIGPDDAAVWLSEHGSSYGLCQIYANEPWHYELRPTAADHDCPAMYADPTDDPRLRE
jgi:hypothetical protein